MKESQYLKILKILFYPLIIVLTGFLLLILYVLSYLCLDSIFGLWLRYRVWRKWPSEKFIVLMYSNSPNWKDYIEKNILPVIEKNTIVLNWSERSTWDWKRNSLEFKAFFYFVGLIAFFEDGKSSRKGKEFNPAAIVFDGMKKPKVFRFYKAFKDYKHGKGIKLREIQTTLFEAVEERRKKSD